MANTGKSAFNGSPPTPQTGAAPQRSMQDRFMTPINLPATNQNPTAADIDTRNSLAEGLKKYNDRYKVTKFVKDMTPYVPYQTQPLSPTGATPNFGGTGSYPAGFVPKPNPLLR